MLVARLGGYLVYDVIAAGGMANVHFGRRSTGELVAIKRVDPRFATKTELVSALEDEGRVGAHLRHPNLLTARDFVVADGEAILVIDYVHGGSLAELERACAARGEHVPLDIAAAIIADALRGLAAAHAARDAAGAPLNLIHRDLSPQNLLVGVDGGARIADFGVAKFASREARTRTGQVKGKLTYLAPEQVHGNATPQSDIFSLAVTAWELITGQPLFSADTDAEVLARVLAGPIRRASTVRADIPPALDDILARALSRPVEQRFSDAAEMAEAILATTTPASAERVGKWVAETLADLLAERTAIIARIDAAAPEAESTIVSTPLPVVLQRRKWLVGLALATLLALAAIGLALPRTSLPIAAPSSSASTAPPPVAEVNSSPVVDAAAPASTPSPAPPSRPRPASRDRRSECDPPFVIDDQHHKHYKPQCFPR